MTARPQTAIADALQRAGFNTEEARLRQIGLDALRKHHRNIERALTTFENAIDDDPELIREALLFYLCCLDAQTAAAGHLGCASQPTVAGTDRGGAALTSSDSHTSRGRPVVDPSAEDRAAAGRVALSVALTVFDSFKVRDGRAIGDVRFGELRRMMSANAIEAAVIRQILDHGEAPHDARVRDMVKVADLQKMIQRAAEIVDAA